MRPSLKRFFQRLLVAAIGVVSVWVIVFVVFKAADRRLPLILAVAITYAIAAYIVLPYAVRMGLKILHRRRVPSYTTTGDGLPGDPVNVLLIGTRRQLCEAFSTAGWTQADPLCLTSSWRMVSAFVLNSPYPAAPFSILYLFGRGQDIGFQKAIDNSPRKRHHIRFWALSLERAEATIGTARFWRNTDCPPEDEAAVWVGAGTRDTGFSLTRLTFQVTHATDSDTNVERDYIIAALKDKGVIKDIVSYQAQQRLQAGRVNRYITDGEVTAASLIIKS